MRNEYKVNWKLYRSWLMENMLKTPKLQFKIFWCVMTILCIVVFIIERSYIALLFAVFCIYQAFIRDYIAAKRQYKALADHHKSDEWTRTILIGDDNIELIEGEDSFKYDYSRILGIREKREKIYLDMDDKTVVRMYRSSFVDADWDLCKGYIESRMNR